MQSAYLTEIKEWLKLRRRDFDRIGVCNSLVLAAYNAIANGPDDRRRALLFGRSHLNLMGRPARFAWKRWPVRDGRVMYDLPLRDEHAGFDWARALTALGHDIEVKQVYRFLVLNTPKGRFIDIGANYGQHSHYFMAAGWDVWSFEPNPSGHEYHEQICALNGWSTKQWIEAALSNREAKGCLTFPRGHEYLGRIADDASSDRDQVSIEVSLRPLFAFFHSIEDAVVKIDVEGHERQVLEGAPPGLEAVRCLLFEALTPQHLEAVRELCSKARLEVFALRLGSSHLADGALEKGMTNFAAAPFGSAAQTWLASRLSDD